MNYMDRVSFTDMYYDALRIRYDISSYDTVHTPLHTVRTLI